MDVRDKVAIVTGAGSGIGRATAERLAAEGCRVVVADVNEADGRATEAKIGTAARFVRVDTTEEDDVAAMFAFAESEFGGVDIVHNNAGITSGYRFPDMPSERWQRVLDINLRGVIMGTFYAVPALKKRGGGVVIQTASAAGLNPWAQDPVYSATKAGVVNFVRSMPFLWDEAKIRVNCVCPGVVETNIGQHAREAVTPERREQMDAMRARAAGLMAQIPVLKAEQVADAVLRLITDDSLNGKSYHVVAGREWQLL